MTDGSALEAVDVTKRYGDVVALNAVGLRVPHGECVSIVGETGSGKSTLLHCFNRVIEPDEGVVLIRGKEARSLDPYDLRRHFGFVPQDGALFPTMTVRAQIAFGPSMQRWKRNEIREKVETLAEALGIASLLDRRPHGLSGGERQRVALARALAVEPRLLCLDEPLSALDEDTRGEICELLLHLRKVFGFTALHVTHSRSEAARLGDILFKLDQGSVVKTES